MKDFDNILDEFDLYIVDYFIFREEDKNKIALE